MVLYDPKKKIVFYNPETKRYHFSSAGAIYVIRLLPVGQYSHDVLRAVFTSSDDPSETALATALVSTSPVIASDLKTEFKDIQDQETLFLDAAKAAVTYWLDAEGSEPLTA